MKQGFTPAGRLDIPGYPFAELERQAAQLRSAGKPLYNLSIGDPDLDPPGFIVDAARRALDDPQAHQYPSSRGDPAVRRSVARWFQGRFGVELDPDSQVCILIGVKEGLAQLARAVVNPGDEVAVPEPGYPVYSRAGCRLVEGRERTIKLDPRRGFLPDLDQVSGVKLLFLNYPNNPTGATAPDEFLKELANLAESDPALTVAYDMAYSEMCFDRPARSLLEFTPRVVEFHSLSKMANATGYRVGFAVGDPARIAALVRAKEEVDSGPPLPFQRALAALLDSYEGPNPPPEMIETRQVYQRRKRHLTEAIASLGCDVFRSNATFYVWFRVGSDEMPFITEALAQGVILTPGSGFGAGGKGWVRASVTAPDEVIESAAQALRSMKPY